MFGSEVVAQLEYYVYRLVDPRNGETFYVGKGKGNRVFEHVQNTLKLTKENKGKDEEFSEDELSLKQQRIHEIMSEGLEVITLIHRHGMDENTAYEVEAALIEAYPGVTNAVSGHGSDYGIMNTKQVIARYGAGEADFAGYEGSLIIKITQPVVDSKNGDIYEAVRGDWKLSAGLIQENKVPYVFASLNGVIRGVYKVDKWSAYGDTKRIRFEGSVAKELQSFIGKRLPKTYCERGAASPTRYIK